MENEIELEKMKFIAISYLSKELWKEFIALNEPSIHIIMDMLSEEVIFRLTHKVAARKEGEYSFKWYTSWWQELRSKILPSWWVERYPSVMEVKKTVNVIAAYPSIKIGDVEHKAHIDFA